MTGYHLETRIFCQCGQRFYHVLASDIPLSRRIEQAVKCPTCGMENTYAYQCDADFSHATNSLRDSHFIKYHFHKNEGDTNPRQYLTKCACGVDVGLTQRRVK